MSALKDLANLVSKTRDGVLPSIQAFSPLDVNTITKDLDLEQHGARNGSRNQPPQDGDLEDSVENDIHAELQVRARKAGEDYRTQLDLYDGRIGQATLATDQRVAIEQAGQAAVTDFKVQALSDLDHLHNLQREVEGRERECETYRVKHDLHRLPHVVPPAQRTFKFIVLLIIVGVEGALNGSFFAQGSEAGLIGGTLQAVILASLNIGLAGLYARGGLPRLRAGKHPALALGITAAYAVAVLGLNLCIGHYRDLYIQHAGSVPASEFLTHAFGTPFQFDDAQSLILILVGIGLNLAAMYDVASMDDPDPAYGALGRRRALAEQTYVHAKEQCLAALMERRDAANETLTGVIDAMKTGKHELGLALGGRTHLHQQYAAHLAHLYDCYLRLVGRYREANVAARTAPAPRRFSKKALRPEFLREPPPLPQLSTGEDDRAQIIERMTHYIGAINTQFEEEVRRYRTIAGLTQEDSGSRHASA